MPIIYLILGFTFLIKGSHFLIEGASSIAKKLKISDLIIGLTIVAFGTSAPEFFVNLTASLKGDTSLALGNILGSNIANLFLILGLSALFCNLVIKDRTVLIEAPISLGAVLLLWILGNNFFMYPHNPSYLNLWDGLIFLIGFGLFLFYAYRIIKKEIFTPTDEIPTLSLSKAILFTLSGMILLPVGGHWVVKGAVTIATSLGLNEFVIAATIIAVGTSLPELVSSVVAARQKKTDIVIGNIIGSNIFNILWVLGISAIIKPIPITSKNHIDFAFLCLGTLLLILLLRFQKRFFRLPKYIFTKKSGILFLILYVGYVIYLILNIKILP